MNYADSVLQLVGTTPLVKLTTLTKGIEATVLVKLESRNPGGSVKDRIGISMIEAAERDGILKPGGLIIEPTSGNTGIGLALAARLKGYSCLFVMSDKASQERVRYLKALGAEVVIVSSAAKANSPEYYFNTALRLSQEIPGAVMLNQYDNPANPHIHFTTTGPEIWNDTDGKVTHFIAGIGTGGTITGTARYLKQQNPAIKIIAADPVGSAIKTFKETGRLVEALPYLVEGVGQERIPLNLDINILDEVMNISDKVSFDTARRLAREEGIFCGGSSGMNVAAALQIAKLLPKEAVVVAIICDTGERYLTKHHSDEWLQEKQLLDDARITIKMALDRKNSHSSVPSLVKISDETTIEDALRLMNKYELSQLPVFDNEIVTGVVKENKLMGAVIESRAVLENSIVSYKDEKPDVIESHRTIDNAIAILKDQPIVAIEEFGRIIGILSRHDILEYL